jgi:hypothetical protein
MILEDKQTHGRAAQEGQEDQVDTCLKLVPGVEEITDDCSDISDARYREGIFYLLEQYQASTPGNVVAYATTLGRSMW